MTHPDYATCSDLSLRDAMLTRDRHAWSEFQRRYDRLVRSCIEKVLRRTRGRPSEDELADVRAQFLVDLTSRDMHRLRSYAPERGTKLGTFIGMIATNSAWDHVRATGRRPSLRDVSEVEVIADGPDPSDLVMHRERVRRIGRAIDELSSRDRDFVRLYFVDGLEPEQVARAMDISVKTVYSKTHKIRARLQQIDAA